MVGLSLRPVLLVKVVIDALELGGVGSPLNGVSHAGTHLVLDVDAADLFAGVCTLVEGQSVELVLAEHLGTLHGLRTMVPHEGVMPCFIILLLLQKVADDLLLEGRQVSFDPGNGFVAAEDDPKVLGPEDVSGFFGLDI